MAENITKDTEIISNTYKDLHISETIKRWLPELAEFIEYNPSKETLIKLANYKGLHLSKLLAILDASRTINYLLLAQDRVGIPMTDKQRTNYSWLEEYLEHNKVNQLLKENQNKGERNE